MPENPIDTMNPMVPGTVRSRRTRTPKQVIDQAIDENRGGARLLYAFASICVSIGVVAIIAGMLQHQGAVAVAGSVSTSLLFPAIWQARATRRENIAIRMLELAIDRAANPEEAVKLLNGFFDRALVRTRRD